MTKLASQDCVPCRKGDNPLTGTELEQYLAELPDWELVQRGTTPCLQRQINTRDFAGAMALANRISDLAEAENHHPELVVAYGSLSVRWWTHAIGGLHPNDFIMAARTDALLQP